ncbi:hypothetical protein CLM73_20190 [Achromobacter spanius]|uniref:MmgE/PrpD N-terminal domain-containing protein n=2 Tax=Achromobacter spanius TaxID=217203 RepID=A0A2S0IB36_9BURK|nr:hypothetical protein CLM73_20190 [Achromobacter spanius]
MSAPMINDNHAPSHTEILGERIAALALTPLPHAIVDKLKTCLLYGLVMAVTAPDIETLEHAAAAAHDAPGDARTFLTGQRRAPADAAYVNALRMCSRGQNDTYSDIYAHPGCIVIPVVLALAQQNRASGEQALCAMAAGYETLYAVASGSAARLLERGLRATSMFGVFASTAAAARMMELDAARTAHALGLATQHCAGTMQCWTEGSPEWRIQVANAARAGIVCATLARHGYISARHALEGASGFYRAFAGIDAPPAPDWTWHTPDVVFKPLPGCLINQAPLFLLLQMRREYGFGADEVLAITVMLSHRNASYPGIARHGPFESTTGAVMSGPFMLAVGLRDGTLRMRDFDDLHGPGSIHDLSRRITVTGAQGLPDWGATLEVHLKDGSLLTDRITELSRFAFGWDETDAQLSQLAQEWPWPDGADRYQTLKQIIRRLQEQASLDSVLDCVVGKSDEAG